MPDQNLLPARVVLFYIMLYLSSYVFEKRFLTRLSISVEIYRQSSRFKAWGKSMWQLYKCRNRASDVWWSSQQLFFTAIAWCADLQQSLPSKRTLIRYYYTVHAYSSVEVRLHYKRANEKGFMSILIDDSGRYTVCFYIAVDKVRGRRKPCRIFQISSKRCALSTTLEIYLENVMVENALTER